MPRGGVLNNCCQVRPLRKNCASRAYGAGPTTPGLLFQYPCMRVHPITGHAQTWAANGSPAANAAVPAFTLVVLRSVPSVSGAASAENMNTVAPVAGSTMPRSVPLTFGSFSTSA